VSAVIVDDNAIVRLGLVSLLESDPGIIVLGEAGDGHEALQVVTRLRPDVVLLDVRMPRRDGVSVVAELSEIANVVMLTFTEEPEIIRQAVAQGAIGYVVHGSFDAGTLAQTVKSAARGVGAFSAVAMTAVRQDLSQVRPDGLRNSEHGLSRRQVDVMDSIAAGKSNTEIALELFLSEKTVKNHINQIFAKLGVTSRREAMALWLGSA